MNDFQHQRRSSYGASSPDVGSRGNRTRAQIVEAALRRFTTTGYHATSVDDIASDASTSRATLYQYFEGKDAIFIELMVESGTALARELTHIGRLGPTASGYASLRRWLGESCRIYDVYAPMFIEWANVIAARGSLKDEVSTWVDFHVDRFSTALGDDGADELDPKIAALVELGIFVRFNYVRHVYRPGPGDARLLEALACALQLYLFPDTPVPVLVGGPRIDPTGGGNPSPVTRMGPLGELPAPGSIDRPDPFDQISSQSRATVRKLLDAAGRVFAADGFRAANIDKIVNEAGLARGTFYRYFGDKHQLITALSQEASAAMCPVFIEFADFGKHRDADALRAWLRRFLTVQRKYAGVMRSWTEAYPIDPALMVGAAEVVDAMSHAVEGTFGPRRDYPLDRRAGGLLLSSLLEHVPNQGVGTLHDPTDDDLIEAQALFIERVIFAN